MTAYSAALKRIVVISLLMVVSVLATYVPADAAPPQQAESHSVQEGETWLLIATRYGVDIRQLQLANGVVNPTLLRPGQRLLIPQQERAVPSVNLVYRINADNPIWNVALRSGNPVSTIYLLTNTNLANSVIETQVALPDRRGAVQIAEAVEQPPTDIPLPTDSPPPTEDVPDEPTPVPSEPDPRASDLPLQVTVDFSEPIDEELLGVQGHFFLSEEDVDDTLDLVAGDLDAKWVKYQVDWSIAEFLDGQYVTIDELDYFVDQAWNRRLNVLLSVVKAPDWARSTTEEDGPPIDYQQYNEFVAFLVGRYGFKLAAVEVWNEPNLRREWNGGTINGGEYVQLLAGAYQAIKDVNPGIIVVSAGLAPTGINDGVIAVDDRVYLRQMYEAGLPNYADAIGIHPYGWANAPTARCCDNPNNFPGFTDNPTFYFLDTLEDYREIQVEFGDEDRQLWATEFGWGTVDGLDFEAPEEQPFFAYIDQGKQAEYITAAYILGQSYDFMGPMFLWNLNVSTLYGFDPNQAGYSILLELDRPREAFRRLAEWPKLSEVEDDDDDDD